MVKVRCEALYVGWCLIWCNYHNYFWLCGSSPNSFRGVLLDDVSYGFEHMVYIDIVSYSGQRCHSVIVDHEIDVKNVLRSGVGRV